MPTNRQIRTRSRDTHDLVQRPGKVMGLSDSNMHIAMLTKTPVLYMTRMTAVSLLRC
jgi:hypothetical protein